MLEVATERLYHVHRVRVSSFSLRGDKCQCKLIIKKFKFDDLPVTPTEERREKMGKRRDGEIGEREREGEEGTSRQGAEGE